MRVGGRIDPQNPGNRCHSDHGSLTQGLLAGRSHDRRICWSRRTCVRLGNLDLEGGVRFKKALESQMVGTVPNDFYSPP